MNDVTKDLALAKLMRYCAYQERCHQEVRNKLLHLKIFGDDLEDIMATLISENYLNEERYANAYVSGKFKIKKWGKFKISMNLKLKGVSSYLIENALKTIDQEEYEETVIELIGSRLGDNKEISFAERKKIFDYLRRKGFESEVINLGFIKVKEI
jgi:regulatory protein